jgi:alpha/beta superfamily hydrolase
MKALNNFGFPVVRFNFRGAGLSQGEHDNGLGEVEDARTALRWLEHEFHLPIIAAGFSFGAAIALRAACPDPNVVALISLGTPVGAVDGRDYDYNFLKECSKPKLFISGARDQFGPRYMLQQVVELAAPPKELVFIEDGDHFFEGRLAELRHSIENWVKETLGK